MKHIVVPTDFSDCAKFAEQFAIDYAEKNQSALHFVHAVNPLENYVPIEPVTGIEMAGSQGLMQFFDEQIAEAKRQMSSLEHKAKTQGAKQVNTYVNVKPLYEQYLDIQKDTACNLVVMGSNGSSGMSELLVGSNTQRMVRFANKPVLVLKHETRLKEVKRVIFVSDFDEEEMALNAIKTFNELFPNPEFELELLFINTPHYFEDSIYTLEKVMSFMQNHDLPDYKVNIFNDYSVQQGLDAFCHYREFDMAVIATHAYTGIKHWFNDNIAEEVVNHVEVPVLVVPFKLAD